MGGGTVAGCNVGPGAGAGRDMCGGRFWECGPLLSGNSRDERGDGREVVTDICGMFGCPISRWAILRSSWASLLRVYREGRRSSLLRGLVQGYDDRQVGKTSKIGWRMADGGSCGIREL